MWFVKIDVGGDGEELMYYNDGLNTQFEPQAFQASRDLSIRSSCYLYLGHDFNVEKFGRVLPSKAFGRKNIGGWIGSLAQKISQDKTCWQIKLWQTGCEPPNLHKFSTSKVSCYSFVQYLSLVSLICNSSTNAMCEVKQMYSTQLLFAFHLPCILNIHDVFYETRSG